MSILSKINTNQNCNYIVKQINYMKENSALIFETKNTKCEEFNKFLSNSKTKNSEIINISKKVMLIKNNNTYLFKEIF